MPDISAVCDYVIFRLTAEGNGYLSHLKLQKLLYYIQAWYLAYEEKPLFNGKFQAWIHGPVNRQIYNRFKDTKYMYSAITIGDLASNDKSFSTLSEVEKEHIDAVLEEYAPFSDVQLERLTHREQPWMEAREGYAPTERCEADIDEITMQKFYAARLSE